MLLAYDSVTFQTTLLEYSSEFRLIWKELIANLFIQLANAKRAQTAFFSPKLIIIHHYAVRALYAERIIDILSIFFNF